MRLVGGTSNAEGRVEICLRGNWGTVCDRMWNSSEARVVCRQLGFDFSGIKVFQYPPPVGCFLLVKSVFIKLITSFYS